MKVTVVFVLLFFAVSVNAQSLKEALFGGKLKSDTGAVLRRGDTAKIKENMALKVTADSIKREEIAVQKQAAATTIDSSVSANSSSSAGVAGDIAGSNTVAPANGSPDSAAAGDKALPRDNNKIWKDYITELSTSIKSEVMTSGKIKSGVYSVLIEYDIKPDGGVEIKNVSADPKNDFLERQIKERLILGAPALNPVMGTNGKPRTVAKKQLLTFSK